MNGVVANIYSRFFSGNSPSKGVKMYSFKTKMDCYISTKPRLYTPLFEEE